ncbi:TIGR02646 family protein [Tessaracoccus bendigoensis DSM 12906]|uniref:TIGR02646 family protein n=1 Tax=Tessaracoccus bendigoensis DSM 12906 TaxID=1123357 RepID=A0A1M6E2U3_9ACTN|nr:TIGR02646 family protein [Tessaracoccus bendigoensis DSM 12906]
MRRVRRPPIPESLKQKKALAERQAALDFYANWDGKAKFDGFAAYKAPDIRAALEQAFGGKCAYCETFYAATQPVAIEHYRPKGEVTISGSRVPPGYYWLASEWTNLLPSCTDCNSPRRQDLPGEDAVTSGKANAFPLASEGSRATAPGTEKGERRLLLHPYLDFPEKHLEFVWGTGTVDDGWVRPRNGSAKGATTIKVCALQRRGLRAARRDRLLDLIAHLESVVEARGNASRHPDDPALLEQFERRLAEVARFVADEAPYSAMCRQVVISYHDSLFGANETP